MAFEFADCPRCGGRDVPGHECHVVVDRVHVTRDESILFTKGQPIVIEKLYGPTIACDLRIRFDGSDWVIQRERTKRGAGDAPETRWFEEAARFDCQESLDFGDEPADLETAAREALDLLDRRAANGISADHTDKIRASLRAALAKP